MQAVSGRSMIITGVLALALSIVRPLSARADAVVDYSLPQTYSTALRLLRVDLNYEVTEKDEQAAYLLFRYRVPGEKRVVDGALELVEVDKHIKISVKITKMPEIHEQLLRDALLRKLREDYGSPRPPRRSSPPSKDAGADASAHGS